MTQDNGVASWQRNDVRLEIDARGGHHGIRLHSASSESPIVHLEPVGEDSLPIAADQFIRGDEFHVHYPQGSGSYSLEIVFRVVHPDFGIDVPVLEATISIYTSLLDSHPVLDVYSSGDSLRRLSLQGIEPAPASGSEGCAAATLTGSAAVLLGPQDRPFTTDSSTSNELRLRLFGEFLEKGVIRKARPWIVLGTTHDKTVIRLWEALCASPLPLTA